MADARCSCGALTLTVPRGVVAPAIGHPVIKGKRQRRPWRLVLRVGERPRSPAARDGDRWRSPHSGDDVLVVQLAQEHQPLRPAHRQRAALHEQVRA